MGTPNQKPPKGLVIIRLLLSNKVRTAPSLLVLLLWATPSRLFLHSDNNLIINTGSWLFHFMPFKSWDGGYESFLSAAVNPVWMKPTTATETKHTHIWLPPLYLNRLAAWLCSKATAVEMFQLYSWSHGTGGRWVFIFTASVFVLKRPSCVKLGCRDAGEQQARPSPAS